MAVTAFVVWWLLAKFIPQQQVIYANAMEGARKDYLTALQSEREFSKEREQATVKVLTELVAEVKSLSNVVHEHDTAMKLAHAIELQSRPKLDQVKKDLSSVAHTATQVSPSAAAASG